MTSLAGYLDRPLGRIRAFYCDDPRKSLIFLVLPALAKALLPDPRHTAERKLLSVCIAAISRWTSLRKDYEMRYRGIDVGESECVGLLKSRVSIPYGIPALENMSPMRLPAVSRCRAEVSATGRTSNSREVGIAASL